MTPAIDVGELYHRHAGMVMRRVLRFFPRDEAEEVVHEVFVKVLERIDGFRGDASPTTWLYHLTTNHCINRARDRNRRAALWREHETAFTRTVTAVGVAAPAGARARGPGQAHRGDEQRERPQGNERPRPHLRA